jgi:hypothetical protein
MGAGYAPAPATPAALLRRPGSRRAARSNRTASSQSGGNRSTGDSQSHGDAPNGTTRSSISALGRPVAAFVPDSRTPIGVRVRTPARAALPATLGSDLLPTRYKGAPRPPRSRATHQGYGFESPTDSCAGGRGSNVPNQRVRCSVGGPASCVNTDGCSMHRTAETPRGRVRRGALICRLTGSATSAGSQLPQQLPHPLRHLPLLVTGSTSGSPLASIFATASSMMSRPESANESSSTPGERDP